jgi:uncharacterized membrane protein
VLIPVVLLWLVLVEAMGMVEELAAPVAEMLPVEALGGASVATLVALLLIVGFCFGAGLIARTTLGSRLGVWLEGRLLRRIPAYGMLKTLSRQLTGAGDAEASMFLPAVLTLPRGAFQLVYVIEEHANGFSTVLIPSVPAGLSGPLQYVPNELLRKLEVPLGSVVQSLQAYGIGAGELFESGSARPTPPAAGS